MPRRCTRTGTVGQEEDGEDRQQQHSPAADQGRGCLTSGIRYHTAKCRYVLQEEVQIRTRFRVRGKTSYKRSEEEAGLRNFYLSIGLSQKPRSAWHVQFCRPAQGSRLRESKMMCCSAALIRKNTCNAIPGIAWDGGLSCQACRQACARGYGSAWAQACRSEATRMLHRRWVRN